jgi:hypothetical protein
MRNGDCENVFNSPKNTTGATGPDAEAERIAEEEAKKRVAAYPPGQQGLHDWATAAVSRYADVISLARGSSSFPVDVSLRAELGAAAGRFELSSGQVWKVIAEHHGRSDAAGPAEALVKKFPKDQQGFNDWLASAIPRHVEVIRLAFGDPLPAEKSLRDELEAASRQFDFTTTQIWSVLQKNYRKSNEHVRTLVEEFVSRHEDEIRAANDRQRLGEKDDEEEIYDGAAESESQSAQIRAKSKEVVKQIHEETGCSEKDIRAAMRAELHKHPNIGEISADPPGAHVWMRKFGRWRSTPRGTFAPDERGLFPWIRITKQPLVPFMHSAMHRTNGHPRVHLNVLTPKNEIEREIVIEREKISLTSVNAAITTLTRTYNIYCARDDFARSELIDLLNFIPKGVQGVRFDQIGWQEHGADLHFAQPHMPPDLETISPKPKGALVARRSTAKPQPKTIFRLDTAIGDVGRNYGLHVSGTVKEAQREIFEWLEGCSNIALSCGVSFAALLLRLANEQSGGFHSHGRSGSGKSTESATGESIIGWPSTKPQPGIEPVGSSWRSASEVGIEAFARDRNDLGLFLGELGKAWDIKKQIVPMIYTLESGLLTLRADGQGKLRVQPSISAMAFSTGEPSMGKFLEGAGDTEGRKRRFVDVPALVGDRTALEKFTHTQLAVVCPEIYDLTARFHGALGQQWRRYVVDLGPARTSSAVDQHRTTWLGQPDIVGLLGRDPQDDSVIKRFSFLATALRMATEAQLWPWSIESSDRGILACTLRWANDKDGAVATLGLKLALQKLRVALLATRDANQLIVLNLRPAGRGGPSFKPAPQHAALYANLDLKNPGTVYGFIKNDGERILLFRDAFYRLIADYGDHDGLVEYLKNKKSGDKNLLDVHNERVGKGEPTPFYVLSGAFLRDEELE